MLRVPNKYCTFNTAQKYLRQTGFSLNSGFATGRMSKTMILNNRHSVEVRYDKVNQSTGIGARSNVRFETSPEQSRSASPELFWHENKRYSGYKPSHNSDLELPNLWPLQDDKHVGRVWQSQKY